MTDEQLEILKLKAQLEMARQYITKLEDMVEVAAISVHVLEMKLEGAYGKIAAGDNGG